ncbi:unnamed protein product [Schistosoma turkestanicum]|nr:unnamed protein product [Schistosoma turkestanicum]
MESIPVTVSLLLQQKATQARDLTLSECSKIKQFGDIFGFSEESYTRRKKIKGPNPLSCKHKSNRPHTIKTTTAKRKRKRIKMTWAMKQVVERLKAELVS